MMQDVDILFFLLLFLFLLIVLNLLIKKEWGELGYPLGFKAYHLY